MALSTHDRPFLPVELRGALDWKALAAALHRDPKHVFRLVAVLVAVMIVLLATQRGAWRLILTYCERQADAWRESEIRGLLVHRYGVKPEALERTD